MIRLFFTFFFFAATMTVSAEVTHTQQVSFKEFHDPGWMILTDQKGNEVSASFYYQLISFEDIDTWHENEPMTITLDDKHGVQLERNMTGKKYLVIFDEDSDPIKERLIECLNSDQLNTYIIADCHSEAGTYYKATADMLHNYLTTNGSEKLSNALSVEQQSWELYQETRNAAIREYLADSFGTKQIIINANDYHTEMKNRLNSMIRFLE
jgi:hypothetical protein